MTDSLEPIPGWSLRSLIGDTRSRLVERALVGPSIRRGGFSGQENAERPWHHRKLEDWAAHGVENWHDEPERLVEQYYDPEETPGLADHVPLTSEVLDRFHAEGAPLPSRVERRLEAGEALTPLGSEDEMQALYGDPEPEEAPIATSAPSEAMGGEAVPLSEEASHTGAQRVGPGVIEGEQAVLQYLEAVRRGDRPSDEVARALGALVDNPASMAPRDFRSLVTASRLGILDAEGIPARRILSTLVARHIPDTLPSAELSWMVDEAVSELDRPAITRLATHPNLGTNALARLLSRHADSGLLDTLRLHRPEALRDSEVQDALLLSGDTDALTHTASLLEVSGDGALAHLRNLIRDSDLHAPGQGEADEIDVALEARRSLLTLIESGAIDYGDLDANDVALIASCPDPEIRSRAFSIAEDPRYYGVAPSHAPRTSLEEEAAAEPTRSSSRTL